MFFNENIAKRVVNSIKINNFSFIKKILIYKGILNFFFLKLYLKDNENYVIGLKNIEMVDNMKNNNINES